MSGGSGGGMPSNFPPGVTGNEYEIAGPDYEKDSTLPCGKCGRETMEQGYRGEVWLICYESGHVTELGYRDTGPDPDAAYDAERDRRMLGIDRPDGASE